MCLVCDLKKGGAPKEIIEKAEALLQGALGLQELFAQNTAKLQLKGDDARHFQDCSFLVFAAAMHSGGPIQSGQHLRVKAVGVEADITKTGAVMQIVRGEFEDGTPMSAAELADANAMLAEMGMPMIDPVVQTAETENQLDSEVDLSKLAPFDKQKH